VHVHGGLAQNLLGKHTAGEEMIHRINSKRSFNLDMAQVRTNGMIAHQLLQNRIQYGHSQEHGQLESIAQDLFRVSGKYQGKAPRH